MIYCLFGVLLASGNNINNNRYMLDTGDSIFVWTGKKASKSEKKESMQIAAKFIADQGRPKHTPVSVSE